MQSHFHLSDDLVLLFDKWRGKTLADHLFFAAAVFIVSVVYQFLYSYLKYQQFLQASKNGRSSLLALFAGLLYQINFIIGYGLMLIVMVHSSILFAAILLGAGVGYFIAEPAYGLVTEHSKNDVYYVKRRKAKNFLDLENERLDTNCCSPEQMAYV